ncbi:BCSC C-terminal domain-containing protein [Klebsiella pneumoniae]|nr:BCSC C-terminal domain-containing protein [Klebsiella pneumoniae]
MLQVDAPLAEWPDVLAATDLVNMDAGSFPPTADGELLAQLGHLAGRSPVTSRPVKFRRSGFQAWRGSHGRMTPERGYRHHADGFNVVDVVGGRATAATSGRWGTRSTSTRRPISSSLLSFGWRRTASSHTGATWGRRPRRGGG